MIPFVKCCNYKTRKNRKVPFIRKSELSIVMNMKMKVSELHVKRMIEKNYNTLLPYANNFTFGKSMDMLLTVRFRVSNVPKITYPNQ